MFNVNNLYTEIPRFKSFKQEGLDLFPDSPDINFFSELLLDPRTGMLFDKKTKTPTYISYTAVLNSNKGWNKHWIRSTPNYSDNNVKIREINERMILNKEYINDISSKVVEDLPLEYTYINLCTGGSYAYGHLLDLVLKLLYLPENIENPCFLISDNKTIPDIKQIITVVSNIKQPSFRVINFTEKKLFKIKKGVELKQVNGICNFSNIQEYELFIQRFSKHFFKKTRCQNLFLTRISPLKRHVINYEELHKKLEDNDICIISGKETFLERAEMLYNAKYVSGYHGALFFDTCFSNESATILEYAPVARPAKCFLRMYKRCQNYFMKFIDSNTDLNVSLDLDELQEFYNV